MRNVLSRSPAVTPFSPLPHTLDRVLLVLLSFKAFPGPPHSKLGIDSLYLLIAHLEKAFLIIYILLTSLFALVDDGPLEDRDFFVLSIFVSPLPDLVPYMTLFRISTC